MRGFVNFIKTTAIGGLLVIVPVAIILFVVAQVAYGLYSMSENIVGKLNIETGEALVILGLTLVVLIGICFLTGLLVQTRFGGWLQGWFGRNVGRRIPMFNAISNLTRRFVGVEGRQFAPVEVDLYGNDTRVIAFLIEELPDGRCVVFMPSAPVATIGNTFIVPENRIVALDASMADTVSAVTQWGVDTHLMYERKVGTDGDS